MIYKIGSFNVRNLNYPVSKGGNRSFDTIASIIKNEGFDVVALQEILSHKVWDQLKLFLGDSWQFAWERPAQYFGESKADPRGEGYAYIWNSKKIDLVEVNVDGVLRRSHPQIWKKYRTNGAQLIREPYYARFTPKGKVAGCFCEIRLINTHIVYGDNNKLGETMRYGEFLKLVGNAYENIANQRYGNRMPAYVIVLGDYNLPLTKLCQNEITVTVGDSTSDRRLERVITRQEELTTVNHVKQDDGTYTSDYVNNYDHFSFLERYQSIMHVKISRVDITKYCRDLVQYWETVSDHVPIKMSINLNNRNL